MSRSAIQTNRAPVLTLWATVVAERLGFHHDEALTLGKAMAGLTAQKRGRTIGVFKPGKGPDGGSPKKAGLGEEFWVEICGHPVPAKMTDKGVRAVTKDKAIDPETVARYLEKKFGEDLDRVRKAMTLLARAYKPSDLADRAYPLYTKFRPAIPKAEAGWGAKGRLDLERIHALARSRK
ncbi:hypothetical protein JW916_12450 [Candidatus Sumerlaeota bacterium]|nr:hypothetical protein [Candidatus Sumerlaeota bacterium]